MTAKALINAQRSKDDATKEVRMLALLGDTATPAAIEREAGMRKAAAEDTDVTILRAFSVDWLFDRAKLAVKQFLLRSDADVIWTASGPIAFGAMEAVKEAGKNPGEDVKFAGIGWFANALDAVSEQTMFMTYGGYFISGAWSMVMLRDIHANIELENHGEIKAPLSEVNLDNIAQFQQYIRNVDWSVVDFSRFLRAVTNQQTYDFSARSLLENITLAVENTACTDC
jgi:ABC-type sugar transport system substrate-binding protein